MFIQIFNTVLKMSLVAGIAIICVFFLRIMLKGVPKVFSYFLWFVVLFRLLCPVSFTSQYSVLGIFGVHSENSLAAAGRITYLNTDYDNFDYISGDIAGNSTVNDGGRLFPLNGKSNGNSINIGEKVKLNFGSSKIIPKYLAEIHKTEAHKIKVRQTGNFMLSAAPVIWGIGLAVMVLMTAISYRKLKNKINEAFKVYDNVYMSDYIEIPFVAGFIRPQIYIPSAINEKDRDYILRHEQYHIKRLDYIAKSLFFAALCIHWFNPLVWLAFIAFVNDMEMSCDEAVMKYLSTDARLEYSKLLLNLSVGENVIKGMMLSFGEGDVKMRIKNIINKKEPRLAAVMLAALVCSIFASCMSANPKDSNPSELETDSATVRGETNGESSYIHIAQRSDHDEYIIGTLEKWADSYVTKNKELLLSMSTSDAYTIIEGMVMPKKPWPESSDNRAYDIIYANDGKACILYYALDSGRITLIRENLEYVWEEQKYKISKEDTKFLSPIDNIDDFMTAYSHLNEKMDNKNNDGSYSFAGTRLDYESEGIADGFALDSTYRYHTPEAAARYVLNLSDDPNIVVVEQAQDMRVVSKDGQEYTMADVLIKFQSDNTAQESISNRVMVTMKKLDTGVWLPESYKTGVSTYKYNKTFAN